MPSSENFSSYKSKDMTIPPRIRWKAPSWHLLPNRWQYGAAIATATLVFGISIGTNIVEANVISNSKKRDEPFPLPPQY